MNLQQLSSLKEELLHQLKHNVHPSDFADLQEYHNFLKAKEEGILHFYALAMNQILDQMSEDKEKKTA